MRAPSEMWERQAERGELAARYWDLAGGRPGMRVADVGCGPGYFAWCYANFTGPTGHVHAVDAEEAPLAYLRSRLVPEHHAHVTTELLDAEKAALPELHFDAVFCTDVLHHVGDIAAFLRNLRQSRARLVIAEFDPSAPGEYGPDLSMRIAPEAMLRALKDAGWRAQEWHALAHEHYAIVAMP